MGFVIGAVLLFLGTWAVLRDRRRESTPIQALGLVLIAIAVVYLLVGALATFGPDHLTGD